MKDSHIQWTDNTFNPWEGCTKVSPGCLNCYAETRNKRFAAGANWGKGAPRRRTSASNWNEPKRWNAAEKAKKVDHAEFVANRRPRVFCASLADVFDPEVPTEWLADLLGLVRECSALDWQLLTKRPEFVKVRLLEASREVAIREINEENAALEKWIVDWVYGRPPANVWLGVSVEDQTRADSRIPLLLALPAAVRFLSCEPLLGRIEFSNVTNRADCVAQLGKPALAGIHWVIVGGESGNDARVTDLGAVESLIHQCRAAKVACFVKQLGARPDHDFVGYPGSNIERRLRLKHPKGGDLDEWPERFRVRQFPGDVK